MSRKSVIRSTAIVSACTGLSRLLGFVREILMGYFFGTSLAKSAFDVAFKIPNLFRRLFGEGALSAAFIPVFTETLEKEGLESADRLAGKVTTMLASILSIIVMLGVVVTFFATVFFDFGPRAELILELLTVMFPYMFFICIVALSMAILNSFHHFAVPALTPVLLNVVWITVLAVLCPRFGVTLRDKIYIVALGIFAAGLLQLLFQVPALRKHGIRLKTSFDWNDARVKKILVLMGPAAVGMGIVQLNTCVDGFLAFFFVADWAPAALTYSERLIYLPLGIFATALGTVLLPTFSGQAIDGNRDGMLKTLASSTRGLMLIMIPASIGLLVLARPIIELVYIWKGGQFNAESVVQTTRALWFYAPGLAVFSMHKLLVPVFYAQKDMLTPVKVGVRVVFLNLALNIIFIMTWPVGFKHSGLACATVLASVVNSGVLAILLTRRIGSPGWGAIFVGIFKVLICAAVMGVAVYFMNDYIGSLVPDGKAGLAVSLAVTILTGIAVYAGLVSMICRKEVRELIGGFVVSRK